MRLVGCLIRPAGAARAVIQFNAGTAARLRFYEPFLEYLAGRGFACALWDYRGSGASVPPGGMRGCDYTYAQYGTHDIPAVTAHLRARFPALPLLFVCHSAGGQQLPFGTDFGGVAGALCFAVSSGYTGGLARYYRPVAALLWHVLGPLSLRRRGYLAIGRLGGVEDLPREVFRQWRRWCSRPDYYFDERFYGREVPRVNWAAMTFPVRHVHATSDEISSARNVRAFWRHWRPAGGVEQVVLEPAVVRAQGACEGLAAHMEK